MQRECSLEKELSPGTENSSPYLESKCDLLRSLQQDDQKMPAGLRSLQARWKMKKGWSNEMSNMIERMAEALATRATRRGFFSTVGKITVAGAALLAGIASTAKTALAAPQCCTGIACMYSDRCNDGYTENYRWLCCSPAGTGNYNLYWCHDCELNGDVCVYATFYRSGACIGSPVPVR
jgi:hypothetical protein